MLFDYNYYKGKILQYLKIEDRLNSSQIHNALILEALPLEYDPERMFLPLSSVVKTHIKKLIKEKYFEKNELIKRRSCVCFLKRMEKEDLIVSIKTKNKESDKNGIKWCLNAQNKEDMKVIRNIIMKEELYLPAEKKQLKKTIEKHNIITNKELQDFFYKRVQHRKKHTMFRYCLNKLEKEGFLKTKTIKQRKYWLLNEKEILTSFEKKHQYKQKNIYETLYSLNEQQIKLLKRIYFESTENYKTYTIKELTKRTKSSTRSTYNQVKKLENNELINIIKSSQLLVTKIKDQKKSEIIKKFLENKKSKDLYNIDLFEYEKFNLTRKETEKTIKSIINHIRKSDKYVRVSDLRTVLTKQDLNKIIKFMVKRKIISVKPVSKIISLNIDDKH